MVAMNARVALAAAIIAGGVGLATPGWALDNDPKLENLCIPGGDTGSFPCGTRPTPDQEAFASLAKEYGMIFAPSLVAPAETMGINGFQFNIQVGLHAINASEDYWTRAVEDGDPSDFMSTVRLDVRKGLPYSFEVGMNATYLVESELWAFGGMLKWALNESVDAFPVDIAVRGSVNRVVGSPQIELTTVGLDAVLGKSFGVGGVANLSPYIGYSPVWTFARSGVIDGTPGNGEDLQNSFVFAEEEAVLHRFLVGTRVMLGGFNLTPEAAIGDGLFSLNFNVGVDF